MGEEPTKLHLPVREQSVRAGLPALPGIGTRRAFYLQPLFLLAVVLPTLLATVYFGFFATNVYVSEARFVVRSPTRATTSPLGALLSAGGLSGSSEEANAVIEYVRSRDALVAADADGLVRRAYGAERASWFDRFGSLIHGSTQEDLYEYFTGKVTVETDATVQVTHLTVRAYTPAEARQINQRLLAQAEALVNRLAERARGDAIAVADTEVAEAQAAARAAGAAMAQFRNSSGLLDPEQEAAIRLQMISKLQDELIAARSQLEQLRTYTPQASQIPYLRTRVASLEREISQQTASIAGGSGSLSANAARYQELRLESELADRQLAASIASREEAQAEARRKRAYLDRIAQPSLSDDAAEPRRFRGIAATFVLGLLLWGVLSMLLTGIREHQD